MKVAIKIKFYRVRLLIFSMQNIYDEISDKHINCNAFIKQFKQKYFIKKD